MNVQTVPELAFVSLGSNIEPEHYLPAAVARLQELGRMIACSRVYQNPAIASGPQPDYLNAAVLIETDIQPLAFRERLREIEEALGRIRTKDKFAPRTIDLDLCLYGEIQMKAGEFTLPDPDILTRPHLARTLADLRPDYVVPGSDRKLEDIARALGSSTRLTDRPDVLLLDQRGDGMEISDD